MTPDASYLLQFLVVLFGLIMCYIGLEVMQVSIVNNNTLLDIAADTVVNIDIFRAFITFGNLEATYQGAISD